MQIKTIGDFRRAVRKGPYAWPGGYPLYWVMADGGACEFSVARNRFSRREMLHALTHTCRSDQWRPVALEVNWEDGDLWCDHTGKRIESAYAESD